MNLDLDLLRIISNNVRPSIGKLLISEPLLDDYYFTRSVVLLTDEVKNSYMGFVLNNISEMYIQDVVDDFDDANIPIFIGGPVDKDVLYFIHKFGYIEGAQEIAKDLYIGGELDDIRKIVKQGLANQDNIRFFLGNSGWTPGQLTDEISNNSWLVATNVEGFVFKDYANMWIDSLDLVSDRYQIWKNFPIDPDLN